MASPKSKPPAPPGRATPRVSLTLDRSGGANPTDAIGNDLVDIVARYRKTGELPHVKAHNPLYGDFTFTGDLHDIREAIENAEDNFMDLPSKIRTLADNDWVTFLEMFHDPTQQKILEEAGLQITDKASETPPGHHFTVPKYEKVDETKNDDSQNKGNTEKSETA